MGSEDWVQGLHHTCGELGTPEIFGHRLQTSVTRATEEDGTAGLGQTLRRGRPVGGLIFHGVSGLRTHSPADEGDLPTDFSTKSFSLMSGGEVTSAGLGLWGTRVGETGTVSKRNHFAQLSDLMLHESCLQNVQAIAHMNIFPCVPAHYAWSLIIFYVFLMCSSVLLFLLSRNNAPM